MILFPIRIPPPTFSGVEFLWERSSPLPIRQRGFAKGIGKKREKEDQWSERKRLTASAALHGHILPEDCVRSITNLRTNFKQFVNHLCPYMVEKTAFLWYHCKKTFCDKLLFVGVHPRLAVIANQCAHWCGNPPVERNQATITTKNCGNSHSLGYFSVHFPSNRGIATTSVRTGLAMTALFFKHQFVGRMKNTDKRISESVP